MIPSLGFEITNTFYTKAENRNDTIFEKNKIKFNISLPISFLLKMKWNDLILNYHADSSNQKSWL